MIFHFAVYRHALELDWLRLWDRRDLAYGMERSLFIGGFGVA